MTPDRLNFMIEACWRRHRKEGKPTNYDNIARFLGVKPITLRRWLSGERPIPRMVEVTMVIFYRWADQVTAEGVEEALRDLEAAMARGEAE